MVVLPACLHLPSNLGPEDGAVLALRAVLDDGSRAVSYQRVCPACRDRLMAQGVIMTDAASQQQWLAHTTPRSPSALAA